MGKEVRELLVEGRNCLVVWKKRIWLIIAMAIVGLVIGNVLTLKTEEKKYMATAKISSYSVNGDQLVAYSSLIDSLMYCEEAAKMLGDDYITAERVHDMVSVVAAKTSPIISIQVVDTEKGDATKIANALAKVSVNQMNKQKGVNVAQVLEEASLSVYSNPNLKALLIRVGCALLAAFATAVVLGIKAIDSKRIVVVEDFTCGGELTVIGMIPLYEGGNLKSVDREEL